MTVVPLCQAAAALGVTPRTLRRWLHAGAPTARRGGRGRGRVTLVDVQLLKAWRASQRVTLAAAAARLPDLMADLIEASLATADGLPKARMAPYFAGLWYSVATGVMDELRRHDPAVPDVTTVPLAVERLRKIGR